MRYWEDMLDKYGFNDGGSQPPHCDEYRALYVLTVNRFAERLGSTVRAVAYDRPGMHNGCMVLFYPLTELEQHWPNPRKRTSLSERETFYATPKAGDLNIEPVAVDDAMEKAISHAMGFSPDEYIAERIRINRRAFRFDLAKAVSLSPPLRPDPSAAEE